MQRYTIETARDAILRRCVRSDDGCLILPGNFKRARGYADVHVAGKRKRAHTVIWEASNGPVPDGLVLDHSCHRPETCSGGKDCPHRHCMELSHISPVTNKENVLRGCGPTAINSQKTHCPRGHEFNGENLHIKASGHRQCKKCRAYYKKRHKDKLRGGPPRKYTRKPVDDSVRSSGGLLPLPPFD